jgi:type IV secretion system protein VirB9
MKRLVAIITPALLAACASTPPEGPTPTNLVSVGPAPDVQIIEKSVPVLLAPEPVVKEKPKKGVDPVTATRAANKRAIEMPRPERFIGSTLIYPIVPGATYNVLTAVNDITSIEMPPGCRMNAKSPMIGDPSHAGDDQRQANTAEDIEPANWLIAKTFHGTPRDPVSKVVVRPHKPDLRTSLQVDTDCGSFRYKLISTQESANVTVRFRQEQPNLGLPLPPTAEELASKARPVASCADTPVSEVRRSYTITGDQPSWRPVDMDVFHTAAKTCIGMPDGLGNLETPSISRPSHDGDEATVYYRTVGRFIEVDQILPAVTLKLGQETVTLTLNR